MQAYIALSKEHKISNGSTESIKKLYDFLSVLQKAEEEETARLVLSLVYTLLGYHKKAYDVFATIADKNNRKDTSKLFQMEETAKTHGDNFAIKLKKASKANDKINYAIDDFIAKENNSEWRDYILNRRCIIFNREFDAEPLEISIHKDIQFSNCVSQIIAYINWLGGDCKKDLIKYFNKNMEIEEKVDNEWYEALEIYSVSITINKEGKIFAEIACGDNYVADHMLDIEIEAYKITSMNYDG
jgi:hypothetical protein